MYKQGEIVLVPFPFTDQTGTSVKRPALVISNNTFNADNDDILLVQITKVERSDEFSVPLTNSDVTKPLKFVSEIRCHKILVADSSIVLHSISNVRRHIIEQVIKKIQKIIS